MVSSARKLFGRKLFKCLTLLLNEHHQSQCSSIPLSSRILLYMEHAGASRNCPSPSPRNQVRPPSFLSIHPRLHLRNGAILCTPDIVRRRHIAYILSVVSKHQQSTNTRGFTYHRRSWRRILPSFERQRFYIVPFYQYFTDPRRV